LKWLLLLQFRAIITPLQRLDFANESIWITKNYL
jgi:hypothetical protein